MRKAFGGSAKLESSGDCGGVSSFFACFQRRNRGVGLEGFEPLTNVGEDAADGGAESDEASDGLFAELREKDDVLDEVRDSDELWE